MDRGAWVRGVGVGGGTKPPSVPSVLQLPEPWPGQFTVGESTLGLPGSLPDPWCQALERSQRTFHKAPWTLTESGGTGHSSTALLRSELKKTPPPFLSSPFLFWNQDCPS